MSNLSDLYISQSYYGVVNLVDSTKPFVSQSTAIIQFQDGIGESLGISVTDVKDFIIDNNLYVSGAISSSTIDGIGNVTQFSQSVDSRLDQLEVDSASQDSRLDNLELYTASQDLINQGYNTFTQSYYVEFSNYSASVSGAQYIQDQRLDSIESFTASLVSDFVTEVEYSASIAVVSGSLLETASFDNGTRNLTFTKGDSSTFSVNIPDATGSIIPPGTVSGSAQLTGSFVTLDTIQTISGRKVFSPSPDGSVGIAMSNATRLTFGSVGTNRISSPDSNRLDLETINSGPVGGSPNTINLISGVSGSVSGDGSIINIETRGLQVGQSVNVRTPDFKVFGDTTLSGSFDVIGTSTFDGTSTFSGSVNGEVINLSVVSSTASMDLDLGNFFKLSLPTGSNTNITATNLKPGMTITLEITQDSVSTGTATFDTNKFSFPRLNQPIITPQTSAKDVATFVSFDSNKLNGVLTNDLI